MPVVTPALLLMLLTLRTLRANNELIVRMSRLAQQDGLTGMDHDLEVIEQGLHGYSHRSDSCKRRHCIESLTGN